MQINCMRCGTAVSTNVPDGTIMRAWIECPECTSKHGTSGRFRRLERVRVRFGANRGCFGTIISVGGDNGQYYGVKIDTDASPVGYCDHELDRAES